jgi:hypothetical protein
MERLKADLERSRTALHEKEEAFTSTSRDPLEQSVALFDIAFVADPQTGATRRGFIILVIAMVFLAVMLFDLTPLLFKVARTSGAYDHLLEVQRTARLVPVVRSAPENTGGYVEEAIPRLPRRSSGRSRASEEPPPPPPRRPASH